MNPHAFRRQNLNLGCLASFTIRPYMKRYKLLIIKMEPSLGHDPRTFALQVRCSNLLELRGLIKSFLYLSLTGCITVVRAEVPQAVHGNKLRTRFFRVCHALLCSLTEPALLHGMTAKNRSHEYGRPGSNEST